jgi:hypothetical protein
VAGGGGGLTVSGVSRNRGGFVKCVAIQKRLGIPGVVHSEFMPNDATINSKRYVRTLQKLKEHIRRVCPKMETVFPQHDNAKPHTNTRTHERLQGFTALVTVLDHSLYIPRFTRRWSQNSGKDLVPPIRRTVLSWRTHETTWITGGSVWTAEVIMLGRNCVKLQKVQEK